MRTGTCELISHANRVDLVSCIGYIRLPLEAGYDLACHVAHGLAELFKLRLTTPSDNHIVPLKPFRLPLHTPILFVGYNLKRGLAKHFPTISIESSSQIELTDLYYGSGVTIRVTPLAACTCGLIHPHELAGRGIKAGVLCAPFE